MFKHIQKITLLFAIASLTVFTSSCQKEEVAAVDDLASAAAVSDADNLMNDASDEAAFRTDDSYTSEDCPTISYAAPKGTFPNTVTVDFGDGCVGMNGRVKSGKIVIELSDAYYNEGSVRTITPVDLKINDWSLEGTKTVTNMGLNEDGFMHWSVEVAGAKVTDPDGNIATWDASRTRTLIEGLETPTCEDNVYEITGGSSGVNRRGLEFTATITSPLVKRFDCKWIVSGVREVAVEGKDGKRIMDFGDGSCDNKATVTLPNGNVREITLRR